MGLNACEPRCKAGSCKKYVLRHGDARETTLNPGFKWEGLEAIGLSAQGRHALPASVASPRSQLRDKANVCARCRTQQRTQRQYSGQSRNSQPVCRRIFAVIQLHERGVGTTRYTHGDHASLRRASPRPAYPADGRACGSVRPGCAPFRARGRSLHPATVATRGPG